MTTKPPATTGEAPSRPTALTHAIDAKPHHRRKTSSRPLHSRMPSPPCPHHRRETPSRPLHHRKPSPSRPHRLIYSKTGRDHLLQDRWLFPPKPVDTSRVSHERNAPPPSHGVAPMATTGGIQQGSPTPCGTKSETAAAATATPPSNASRIGRQLLLRMILWAAVFFLSGNRSHEPIYNIYFYIDEAVV
ncbi:hypothetical protein KSP39_PZI012158 [Platanthera zijinensis]|uniref:Uncharacterized protein n=1 Tax=Platanthera zijinensis TaxID=2320716 RepID=A0AAP0BGS7_9ASPA